MQVELAATLDGTPRDIYEGELDEWKITTPTAHHCKLGGGEQQHFKPYCKTINEQKLETEWGPEPAILRLLCCRSKVVFLLLLLQEFYCDCNYCNHTENNQNNTENVISTHANITHGKTLHIRLSSLICFTYLFHLSQYVTPKKQMVFAI